MLGVKNHFYSIKSPYSFEQLKPLPQNYIHNVQQLHITVLTCWQIRRCHSVNDQKALEHNSAYIMCHINLISVLYDYKNAIIQAICRKVFPLDYYTVITQIHMETNNKYPKGRFGWIAEVVKRCNSTSINKRGLYFFHLMEALVAGSYLGVTTMQPMIWQTSCSQRKSAPSGQRWVHRKERP